MEETDKLENQLETQEGVFVEEISTKEIPDISDKEADENKEDENVIIETEGGN